ncbi:hypothetical protein HHK36_015885 [Tetracentron sinense]|uniref:Small auxin up regulated protein n=1 Tax=Tetracentron sinense TaxID=13715 RepID=A0A834ZDA8_TETSI|nr:hypothetical protein HHK36_015885 [Tetracentron sinense]
MQDYPVRDASAGGIPYMDGTKEKGRKGLILKTWERCRSIGIGGGDRSSKISSNIMYSKSKSWSCTAESSRANKGRILRGRVAPEGCFSVYVGPEKQRFVIKIEYANHPLFKMLLEEAELEFGYSSKGPLVLPCNLDIFYNVLSEMDSDEIPQGCNFVKGHHGSYSLLSPSRMVDIG